MEFENVEGGKRPPKRRIQRDNEEIKKKKGYPVGKNRTCR